MFVEPNQSLSKHLKPLIKHGCFTFKYLLASQIPPLTARSICALPGLSLREIVNFVSATFLSALPAINNSDRSDGVMAGD